MKLTVQDYVSSDSPYEEVELKLKRLNFFFSPESGIIQYDLFIDVLFLSVWIILLYISVPFFFLPVFIFVLSLFFLHAGFFGLETFL